MDHSDVDELSVDPTFVDVVDVVLLSPCCPRRPRICHPMFVTVPPICQTDNAAAADWYLGKLEKLPMELVQHDRIIDTDNTRAVLKRITAWHGSNSGSMLFRIMKRYDGSGATSLLGRVAWQLEGMGFHTFFLTESVTEVNVDQFWNAFTGDGCHAVLVDDKVSLPSKYIEQRRNVRVVVIQIVKSGKFEMELDPFLSMNDLERIVPKLIEIIPPAALALTLLLHHCRAHSNSKDDRHIYVVMHCAATGKFKPARTFLFSILASLKGFDRDVSVFLAVLSAFCGGKGVGINSLPTHWARGEVDLITTLTADGSIRFMHPFLALLFLRCVSGDDHKLNITSIWNSCSAVWASLVLAEKQSKDLFSCLFTKRKKSFSPFVYKIYTAGGINLMQTIVTAEPVSRFLPREHWMVLLSRVYRLLENNASLSLHFAISAYDLLCGTRNGNLALNNLCCSQGYYCCQQSRPDNFDTVFSSMKANFGILIDQEKSLSSANSSNRSSASSLNSSCNEMHVNSGVKDLQDYWIARIQGQQRPPRDYDVRSFEQYIDDEIDEQQDVDEQHDDQDFE